jgi:hypothetical protein
MLKLLFDETASPTNNNFHPGLNVTVRRGTKYLDQLRPGDAVQMENLQGEDLGDAIVHQMIAGPMKDIPECILAKEHDSKCRALEGLVEVMQNCYHDPELDGTEIVTALVINVFNEEVERRINGNL